LSGRAKDLQEETEAVQEYSRRASTGGSTLGDLLKEKLGSSDNSEGG
jgi:small subunit ribosomal protein S1